MHVLMYQIFHILSFHLAISKDSTNLNSVSFYGGKSLVQLLI